MKKKNHYKSYALFKIPVKDVSHLRATTHLPLNLRLTLSFWNGLEGVMLGGPVEPPMPKSVCEGM